MSDRGWICAGCGKRVFVARLSDTNDGVKATCPKCIVSAAKSRV